MDRGYMISFEGPDGSGKTSCLKRVADALRERGYDILVSREPGGNGTAEKIRELLLEEDLLPVSEALLFAAARNEHVYRTVFPALKEGKIVLCDRFLHSSLAYQGEGRELGVKNVEKLNDWFLQGYRPDLVLYFKCPGDIRKSRIGKRAENNRMDRDRDGFGSRVEKGFEGLQQEMVVIDACQDEESVFRQVMDVLEERMDL